MSNKLSGLGNLTIRNLIISYILLYSIMPIVGRLTSSFLTTYFYMAVVVILTVIILALDRPEKINQYFTFLLPFFVYQVLTLFSAFTDVFLWSFQFVLALFPVILGYYLTQDTARIHSSYSWIIVFAIVVTMITTIIGCIENPNASRVLASLDSTDIESYNYGMKNIGGYSFVYSMVLLYPVLILSYKTRRIKLLPTIIITVIILLTVIYSEYTTALLLFVITSLLFLTKRNLSVRGIVMIAVFAIVFLLAFTNVIVDFLHWLSHVIGSKDISTRLDALAGGTAGLESSEDNRLALYSISLGLFFENPLFGTLFKDWRSSGGHSFIFDSLSFFGLFGGALLFFMYKNIFTRFFLPFKDKPGFGYVVWTFIQAIILSVVNTGMWLEALCLFCPILFYWIYGTETNTESQTEEANDEDTVDREHAAGSAGRATVRKTE